MISLKNTHGTFLKKACDQLDYDDQEQRLLSRGSEMSASVQPEQSRHWTLKSLVLAIPGVEFMRLMVSIDESNAKDIKASCIVEGANNPVTSTADDILTQRGIVIVPDILANAGGVVVSYFEWVQNSQSFPWTEEMVKQRLQEKLSRAVEQVANLSVNKDITLREAIYQIATSRLKEAMFSSGI